MERQYYSQRKGIADSRGLTLDALLGLFELVYEDIIEEKLLYESMGGWECTDGDGPEVGKLGRRPEVAIMLTTKKSNLYPIQAWVKEYSEDDLFDIIEFLYDHVSIPVSDENTYFHSHNGCGYHYERYDVSKGREMYAFRINQLLNNYSEGYEISDSGEIVLKPQPEVARLMKNALPNSTPISIIEKVDAAKAKFLNSRTGLDGRRDAIRDLADIFESLKKSGKLNLNQKDDSLLFELANNFSIRHFGGKQKTDYNENVWLSWMFHFYLATLHACLRMEGATKK